MRKQEVIQFRVTVSEKEEFREFCKRQGVSQSFILRHQMLRMIERGSLNLSEYQNEDTPLYHTSLSPETTDRNGESGDDR